MNIPKLDLLRLVIIGGGFAGLKLARKIDTRYYQVVLLDRNNYHTFQPLMYQVATAGLEPDSIAYPLRKTLKNKKHTHIRMCEVEAVDTRKKVITTSIGELSYDKLIIATGADSNYFGNKNIEKFSMPMKSLLESLDLRSLILQNFEKATDSKNIEEQNELMSFVIVGGGPTGVELAGALAELKEHVLPKDYPDLDIRRMQIHLIEASDRVLNAMSEKASKNAEKYLKKMKVNVWTNTMVEDYDGHLIQTSKDNFQSQTLIWAAGVQAVFPKGLNAEVIGGRLRVNEFNELLNVPDLYAIGDCAALIDEKNPKGYPMLASVAQQQGKALAKNLKKWAKNQKAVPFKYRDKGTMATVGRNKAVVDLPRFKFGGFFAWLTWMFVHLMLLVDFRSRIVVFVNWVWSYINFDRGTRLIVRKFKR
jgi:NADH dehydrogenase